MGAGRVEAFSDGVIAVIITIMVLEFKAPSNGSVASLLELKLAFLNYALSFVLVAIMWVNHRAMLALVKRVSLPVLWANNLLLFWMSLIPFATAYMGQSEAAPLAVATYGALLAVCSGTFGLLRLVIARQLKERNRPLHLKDLFGLTLYALSVPLAFASVKLSFFIFILIPLLYFLPERKLEELSQFGE